jgi:hypothetical protein
VRAAAAGVVTMSATRTASVSNVWGAAALLAGGLAFVRAGGAPRVTFVFADPEGRAPELLRAFHRDRAAWRLIAARRAMGEALAVAGQRGLCETDDVATALAAVDIVQ